MSVWGTHKEALGWGWGGGWGGHKLGVSDQCWMAAFKAQ